MNEKSKESLVASSEVPTVEPLELSETVQRLVEWNYRENEEE